MPVGMWASKGSVFGDASGGQVNIVNQIFENHLCWSFEGIWWRSQTGMLPTVIVGIPMYHNGIQALVQGAIMSLVADYRRFEHVAFPFFGIVFRPISATNAADMGICQVSFPTNVNLEFYEVNLWGFYWKGDALKEGLPLKPNWTSNCQ